MYLEFLRKQTVGRVSSHLGIRGHDGKEVSPRHFPVGSWCPLPLTVGKGYMALMRKV